MRGAELGHRRGHCTFEALLERHRLTDAGLHRMARIIRSADLPHEEPAAPEASGVVAIFDGIRDGSSSDGVRLEKGFVVCEALYAYCSREPRAGRDF